MSNPNRPGALVSASILAVAVALGSPAAMAQTQDRVDQQQIETVPAGPSDVTVAPEPSADESIPAEPGTTEAGAEVDEAVQAAERDPETGQVEAAEAGAEPTESWFGCKPAEGEQMASCDEAEAAEAAAQDGGQAASQ